MAEVIAIPLTGWLTRALSLRWMFAAATLGFTVASLGCALCETLPLLIAVRVVQGFCGGMLIPAVFTSVFLDDARKTSRARHHPGRRAGRDRADHRAADRRLSHRALLMALDFPDQHGAGRAGVDTRGGLRAHGLGGHGGVSPYRLSRHRAGGGFSRNPRTGAEGRSRRQLAGTVRLFPAWDSAP